MASIVLSVAHTGTRFLCRFLDSIGVIYRQYHSDPSNIDDLKYEINNKAIVPVRDPLLCFVSTYYRCDPKDFELTLDNVVMNYDLLIELETWFECEYLRIDSRSYEDDYNRIHKFTDAPLSIDHSLIDPVGNINQAPTDYKMWGIVSKDWSDDKKLLVTSRLEKARKHCGY